VSCIECDGRTERSVYPYWGRAPGGDRVYFTESGIAFAQGAADPPETWPAHFTEDPEMPGFGSYQCPTCFGKEESEIMEKRLSINDLMKAAGAPEGAKLVALTWASEPDGTMDLNESGDPCAALYVEWRENERTKEDDSFMRALNALMVEHGVSRLSCAFIDVSGEHEGVSIRVPGEEIEEDYGSGIVFGEREYTVVLTPSGGGFSAYLKELPVVIATGSDVEDALSRIRDAFSAFFKDDDLVLHTTFKPELVERGV
jgi:predicted RNase H-like HicB family nuclease